MMRGLPDMRPRLPGARPARRRRAPVASGALALALACVLAGPVIGTHWLLLSWALVSLMALPASAHAAGMRPRRLPPGAIGAALVCGLALSACCGGGKGPPSPPGPSSGAAPPGPPPAAPAAVRAIDADTVDIDGSWRQLLSGRRAWREWRRSHDERRWTWFGGAG